MRNLTRADRLRIATLNQEIEHSRRNIIGIERDLSEGRMDRETAMRALMTNRRRLDNAQRELNLLMDRKR